MDTKILELLIKNFEEGKYKTLSIIIIFLVIITFIWKFKDFSEYWSNRQNFRRKLLEETINKIHKQKVRNLLEDELIREYFVRVFKFNAEVIFIERLIDFHISLHGEFTFNQLMKSSKYMKIIDGRLTINLTRSDSIMDKWFYWIISLLLVLLGLYSLVLFIYSIWQNNWQGFIWLLFAFLMLILGIIARVQAFPYQNAEKLKIKLDTLERSFKILCQEKNKSNLVRVSDHSFELASPTFQTLYECQCIRTSKARIYW